MRIIRWILGSALVAALGAAGALVLGGRPAPLAAESGFLPASPARGAVGPAPAPAPVAVAAPAPVDPALAKPRSSTLVALEAGSETPRAPLTPMKPRKVGQKPGGKPLAPPAPLVAAGAVAPPHETDVAGIKAALGEIVPQIRECYEAWLEADPDHAPVGRVMLAFTIETDPNYPGKAQISDAGIEDSELDNQLLEGCVLSSARSLKFVPPEEPVDVTYPLDFARE